MKIVITPRAQEQIDNQLAYSVARFGVRTAGKTADRIERFLNDTIAAYPRTGTSLLKPGLYESIIPHTPFVVIYRIEEQIGIVRVLALFHHAQDRSGFEAD